MSASMRRRRALAVNTAVCLAALLCALGAGMAPTPSHADTGCQELIVNGGFESGHEGWSQYTSSTFDVISPYYPHAGENSAWLVALNGEEGWISQPLTIPAGATDLRLDYWWSLVTAENPGGEFDFLRVQLLRVDNTLVATLATYSNESAESWLWNPARADLSAYAGQVVQIRFYAKNDMNRETNFFVDDVSLQACPAGGTWTPTATATRTRTASPTPTATQALTPSPTASITPGPSPTPTGTPRVRLYLPVITQ